MNDTLEERLLADHLHRVADRAPVPTTPVADDVRRGRGRLRRRRALVAAGSAAVVALTAGGFALVGGGTEQRSAEPPVADGPVEGGLEAGVPDGVPAREPLVRQLESLRDEGDPAITLAELSAMTEVLQDRLRGDRVLWFRVGRGTSWDAVGGDVCPSGWTCEDVTVDGASRAVFARSGTVRQLVVELPGDAVVLTFNTVDERPTELAYRTD